jgi:lipoprotein-anchoring transpeptidase ErfK/SrfK
MRKWVSTPLQMSWLATALAALLGLATPAASHLTDGRVPAAPSPVHRALAAGPAVAVVALHDQPYPPHLVVLPRRVHRGPRRIPVGSQLLVRVPAGGIVAHREPRAASRPVGTVRPASRFYGVPITIWVEATNATATWGKVQLPYVWPRTDGWIPLHGLSRSRTRVVVSVDLSEHTVRVYRSGTLRYRVRAATGAPASPTPPGDYVVTDRVAFGSGALGSFAFGISGIQPRLPAGWSGGDQLAIHGTNEPWSIGRSVSAGCVRVSEWSLDRFRPLLQLGTPVIVRP